MEGLRIRNAHPGIPIKPHNVCFLASSPAPAHNIPITRSEDP